MDGAIYPDRPLASLLDEAPVNLGGYAALAESAWMGSVQATEILDSVHMGAATKNLIERKPLSARLSNLALREYGIREASLMMMVSFLLSAGLGAIRQVLFNAQFGTSLEANAYYAAFRLPDVLFSLVAGGALSSAMIPVLLRTVNQEGEVGGRRLASLVLSGLLAAFAAIVFIGELFTPAFVTRVLAPGFDPTTSQLAVKLTRIMLLQPLVLATGSVTIAILNSRNQFFLTSLSVAAHNIALISGILAVHLFPSIGIYGPTLGVVGGAVLQAVILLPGLVSSGGFLKLAWNPKDIHLREVIRLLIPNGLAVGVSYAGFIVDTAFATTAAQAAGLAAIYNAWLLVGLPIALLGQAVGQAAFPRLSAQAAAGDWQKMRSTLLTTLLAAIGLAIPALLALDWLGRPVIHLLFEHGKFDPVAGDLTYRILTTYALALPAYVATELISRGLIALLDTRTPLLTNTLQLGSRAIMLIFLIPAIGVLGIPTAFAIAAAGETLLLGSVLGVKLQRRMVLVRRTT